MIRKAKIQDVQQIQNLINHFAAQDLMLPRSLNELYDNIRDFWVFDENKEILGCLALHICWDDLAEIKSLAVETKSRGRNIGVKLLNSCIDEARNLGAGRLFVLTYIPEFFEKSGFKKIKYEDLPHKIWAECINCPKFPNCKETALLKIL